MDRNKNLSPVVLLLFVLLPKMGTSNAALREGLRGLPERFAQRQRSKCEPQKPDGGRLHAISLRAPAGTP